MKIDKKLKLAVLLLGAVTIAGTSVIAAPPSPLPHPGPGVADPMKAKKLSKIMAHIIAKKITEFAETVQATSPEERKALFLGKLDEIKAKIEAIHNEAMEQMGE